MTNTNHDDELRNLLIEEGGKMENAAATASLDALQLLGAMTGPVTPKYQMETAKCLARVLIALPAVRQCLEHTNPGLRPERLLVYYARLSAMAVGADPEVVVRELINESLEA